MSLMARLAGALLLLYPASFRNEYGREIMAIFVRRYAQAESWTARTGVVGAAILDTIRNAPAIHLDILRHDLRFSVRTLARLPLFSVTVMLISAVGIGATTAAFSVADHVLIRPLPFREPDRLVKVWEDHSYRGYRRMELSPANFRDLRAAGTSFESFSAFYMLSANLVAKNEPIRVDAAAMLGDLFSVLGVQPAIGRGISEDDSSERAPGVVVLSDRLWRTRFDASPDVVGTSVLVDNLPRTVIGVMPPTFEFPTRETDVWIAAQFPPDIYEDRTNNFLQGVGRLRTGVDVADARAELTVLLQRIAQTSPGLNTQVTANVLRLRDEIPLQSRLLLYGLLAASLAVLAIAWANLANLFLTRALVRQRELAVRAALGAGRDRLVRQLFTEGALLAGAGGVLGIGLAITAVPLAARLVPTTLPIAETPGVDLRMMSAAVLTTVATAIAFALFPAMRTGRHSDASALRDGERAGASRRTERVRSLLVVAEVTASVVLLVCSALLVQALLAVQQTDPGFRADGVLTLRTALPTTTYAETARREQFYNAVLSDVRALPGVTHAAYTSFVPMVMRGGVWPVTVDGKPQDIGVRDSVLLRQVTPGYFPAMGIPLLRGRVIASADTAGTQRVAVVSEGCVRQHWPGLDPIGRRLFVAFNERVVVGVVGDVRIRGLEGNTEPQVYIPSAQVPDNAIVFYAPKDLVVRSSVPPTSLVPAIREIISRVDPQQPVSDVQTMQAILERETAARRVQVLVIGAFAAIAFLLAGVGLHGVLAFSVSSRARDIGVRMALGADRREIILMILRQAVLLAGVGIVLGGALAWAAGRSMQALLAGVSPTNGLAFGLTGLLVLVMTSAGSLLPALRAVRIDPIMVIRSE